MTDVLVIGAGVVGLLSARALAMRGYSVTVLEAEHDVGRGASGRNSGVVHPGFNVKPGTLKARLNTAGASMMRELCDELGADYRACGTLVVAAEASQLAELEHLRAMGTNNGLDGLRVIEASELAELEPGVAGTAAFFAPQGAIMNPFLLVENAAAQLREMGSRILVNHRVHDVRCEGGAFRVEAADAVFSAKMLVNAAGVEAPSISCLAGAEDYECHPSRGEYLILDRAAHGVPSRMVYPVPGSTGGLGVHFTPTTEGNTLIGPSAEYVDGPTNYATSGTVMQQLIDEARTLCPGVRPGDVIASFSGVRAKIARGTYGIADFVVQESPSAPGLINLVGIESPGLTASPAIALDVVALAERIAPPSCDAARPSPRRARERFLFASDAVRSERAVADPAEREIVCRCEQVTRREILDALADLPDAPSLAALKPRCRAGTGRCQGSFCTPRVARIVAEELGSTEALTAAGPGTELFSDARKGGAS